MSLDEELLEACENGEIEKVQFLLDQGADVNVQNCNEYTPLHLAAKGRHKDVAKLLIENGAEVNVKDDFDHTPLDIAIFNGSVDMINLLVQKNATISIIDNIDLFLAIATGKKEEIESFLKRDKVNIEGLRYHNKYTPLHIAAICGYGEIVKFLIEQYKVSINAEDDRGYTPLYFAIAHKHISVIKVLLQHRAKVYDRYSEVTPLHVAAMLGYEEIVKFFIEQCKIDINVKCDNGETPLHAAANYEHEKLVQLLLQYGADVNVASKTGNTPLHFAVEVGSLSMVESLLNRGASVHAKGRRTTTPLHTAIYYYNENPRIIGLLLEHGADIYAKDTAGRLPEELCTLYHNTAECFFPLLLFGSYTNKDFEYINEDFKHINIYSDKDGIIGKKICCDAFEQVKAMPHLDKLIEANKSRDKKESVRIIANYINNEANGQELIEEFKTIKEKYNSDEQLSFVSEHLLDFIEHITLKSHIKANTFLSKLKDVYQSPNTSLAASQPEVVSGQSKSVT